MHTSDRTLLASLGFADPDKKDRRHTLACQYMAQPDVQARVLAHLLGPFRESATMTEEEAAAVAKAPTPPPPFDAVAPRRKCDIYGNTHQTPVYEEWGAKSELVTTQGEIERAIRRRGGFLVGFWDVVAIAMIKVPAARVVDRYGRVEKEPPRWAAAGLAEGVEKARVRWEALPLVHLDRVVTVEWVTEWIPVAIEVKAGRVDVADAARQMEVYMGEPHPLPGGHGTVAHILATLWPMSELDKATLRRKKIHHVYLGEPFQQWCDEQGAVASVDARQF